MKHGICVYFMKMKVKFDFGGNGRILSTAAGLCKLVVHVLDFYFRTLYLLNETSDRNETGYVCL